MKKLRKALAGVLTIVFLMSVFPSQIFALTQPKVFFVGADFGPGDINTRDYTELFFDDFSNMGYGGVATLMPKYYQINREDRYEGSYVLMFAGHGTNDYVRFNHLNSNGEYACAIAYSSETPVNVNNVSYQTVALQPMDLSTAKLILFVGCQTASSPTVNIAKQTYDNGAAMTVGWRSSFLDVDAEKWMDRLGYEISRGKNILDAMLVADTMNGISNRETMSDWTFYSDPDAYNTILKEFGEPYIKAITMEENRNLQEEEIEIYYVNQTLAYDTSDDVISIKEYILNNIDDNFDATQYNIRNQEIFVHSETGDRLEAVWLTYKINGFETDSFYRAIILNGNVERIYKVGSQMDRGISISGFNSDSGVEAVSEERLCELATSDISSFLSQGYSVVEQKVLKKFDVEPYYLVCTTLQLDGTQECSVKTFEYRI